ncbi:MAG TPA: hypothetical protein V6C86_15740 [Oculatellaceae cyanobacterium]
MHKTAPANTGNTRNLTSTLCRKTAKIVIKAYFLVLEQLQSIVEEAKEERANKSSGAGLNQPEHVCKSMGCRCVVSDQHQYCNEFCAQVESSAESARCGCGHSACDLTKQIGNQSTFDRTTG